MTRTPVAANECPATKTGSWRDCTCSQCRVRVAASAPAVGDTITRVTVSECVYHWELDEYGVGDWYTDDDGPRIVYEHPKWKDVPGVE